MALEQDYTHGLYRYAVKRYQPIIEEQVGVWLGKIALKDALELYPERGVHGRSRIL
jgi:hypothetical protein